MITVGQVGANGGHPGLRHLWQDPWFIAASSALVAAVLAAALALYFLDRWRKHANQSCDLTTNHQLAHFRALYERGELSQEEYDRVRTRLSEQLRRELETRERPG